MEIKFSSEEDLLYGVKQGDLKSQKMLYDRYVEYLSGVCARYIRDIDDRKDVLQNSFVKIFNSSGKCELRGDGALKAWMTKILINEALQFLKKETLNETLEDETLISIADEEPEVELVSDDVINEMILSLPTGYRMVFNLYVFENKTHKEIAQMLNITASTSASQFFRARASLSKMIKEYMKLHKND